MTGGDTVLFIGAAAVGRGEDPQLGSLLMEKFLHTVGGHALKPASILLMNSGVRLVTDDSPVLGQLKQLAGQGVEILACGTCLDRFQLRERVAVGQVSNMAEITDVMLKAAKVISL